MSSRTAGGNSILVVVPDGVVSDLNHWGTSRGFHIDRQTTLATLVSWRHQHIPDCVVGNGASRVLEVDSYRINSACEHLVIGPVRSEERRVGKEGRSGLA